jgi:cation:H+ antiporter
MLLLILGGALLWKGADWLVDGAGDLAACFNVPPIYVGLTVVAFGTSLPELIVSLYAVLTGKPGISIGNIIGSNISNIALIIGVTALICPLVVRRKTISYELPIMLILTMLFPLLANKNYIWGRDEFYIGKVSGIVFLIIFAVFMYYVFLSVDRNDRKEVKTENRNPIWKNVILILIGIVALYFGGNLFVDSSSDIARYFGLSELFIGLTIVSIGTSLPELFTSIMAAVKKETDIAVGNIVGSNIFNIGWVLGLVGLVRDIPFDSTLVYMDSIVLIFISLLLILFAARYKKIRRSHGAILLMMYVAYIGYLIYRG